MTQSNTQAAGNTQKKIRLGDLLVEEEVISQHQLEAALKKQKQSGKKLGRLLVDMGIVNENRMLNALSQHLKIPFLELRRFHLKRDMVTRLPENLARRYRCLVLSESERAFQVAMSDPLDLMARDAISNALGKPLQTAIVREAELLATLDQMYRKSGEIASLAGEIETELHESDFDLAQMAGESSNTQDAPVVRLFQTILEDAVQSGASDIHIEPDDAVLRVRLRIDGLLQEQVMKERRAANALVMRLKIMSNLDISEKRLPQDGRFNIRVLDKSIDIRLATLPTQYGESVVMRLLDQTSGLLTLEKLGMPDDILARFRLQIERPHGLVLVTGPTGSGKTTTLYAALTELNQSHRKIITAEDPIEYRLPRIQQVQVNSRIRLDFARILRSALRQDPDVMLVGEMRDAETVSIGVRAALTGHLVMSTLHTNDAFSSAIRMIDMGVEPYLIASSLRAIVAQRLVRRICDNCREDYSPSAREKIWLEHMGEYDTEITFQRGNGCYQCNNTGYRGRIGVYEFLELDETMVRALRDRDPNRFVQAARGDRHFVPLAERALQYARDGWTDLAEVFRIAADLEDREEDDRVSGERVLQPHATASGNTAPESDKSGNGQSGEGDTAATNRPGAGSRRFSLTPLDD